VRTRPPLASGGFWSAPILVRRNDPDGHVTASAVVARLTGEHFLLVLHRKLDRWLQPGGHVEDGDASVFQTALREVREETGLPALTAPIGEAILDLDIHAIPEFGAEPAHFHYDVRFLVTTRDGGVLPSGVAWFDFADVAPVDRDGSLARAVAKARARLP
jgi:8-oxo-dGTP pyrophosphatase MutT (NUDIX family)